MNGFRMTVAAGVAAAIALGSHAARADEQSGFSLGLRTGYSIAMGSAVSGVSNSDLNGGMMPFWLDAGYRFNPNLYVGGFFQYGLTSPPNHGCGPASSCDGSDLRGGIDATWSFMPSQTADPWLGLGIGYETARVYVSDLSNTETSYIYHGFQYLDIQGGLDLRVVKQLPFGPFFDLSFGQYSKESHTDANGNSSDVPMQSTLHEWLTLGIRGRFDL
jgi:hypothetical protein